VLAALPADVQAIAVDRPGWDGRSRATDLAGNAASAIGMLDAHGVDRAVVVGHSFGGAVAAWLAVHHPDRVEALVLAAPSANGRSLERLDYLLAAPLAGPVLSAILLAGAGLAVGSPLVRRTLAARLDVDETYLRAGARQLTKPASWRAFVVEQRALVNDLPVLEAQLSRITAPTVIVAGEADRIVPAGAARALAEQIPGAELQLLPRAGHLLLHRHADRLAEIIARLR
jgi:pimeloyl-ACP methyl ester carboxylesterase